MLYSPSEMCSCGMLCNVDESEATNIIASYPGLSVLCILRAWMNIWKALLIK